MNILVLAGGQSSEREVSLVSGDCVAAGLRANGHQVDMVDPAVVSVAELDRRRWDVAVPVVHGTGGEDGELQTALLNLGLSYVGSSPAASELTFNKIRTNQLLKEKRIRVPNSVIVTSDQPEAAWLTAIASLNAFALPNRGIVTKPPRQGSSVGVSIVHHESDIASGLKLAFQYDDCCLIERFISGREVTVPVIDGRAFPPVEICTAGEWYDYAAKYADDRTEYHVSPENLPGTLSQTAIDACRLCGVEGIARVDFRVDDAGRPWLLEINTVPGMTSHSLVPKSAASIGMSLAEVYEAAIRTRLSGTGH